jgi:ribosomal protein L31E
VHNTQFKKRAPTGVKEVIKFAQKAMGTKEVRVDPKLNQEIWKLGVKDVPRRVRVRLESEYPSTANATATNWKGDARYIRQMEGKGRRDTL